MPAMIVRDIMTTRLVTVEADDTLAHAANLLRQHQFHHLPVVREMSVEQREKQDETKMVLLFEGLLTSQDIDLAVVLANTSSTLPWQERRVAEIMHRGLIRVTPATSVAAAAQILVERSLSYLPVVEYFQQDDENRTILVGLLTRSDLLQAFSRAMGAFEPGMQLGIVLPMGNQVPLARALMLASELQVPIRSVIAAPLSSSVPLSAAIRLGTINPAPLLVRL